MNWELILSLIYGLSVGSFAGVLGITYAEDIVKTLDSGYEDISAVMSLAYGYVLGGLTAVFVHLCGGSFWITALLSPATGFLLPFAVAVILQRDKSLPLTPWSQIKPFFAQIRAAAIRYWKVVTFNPNQG